MIFSNSTRTKKKLRWNIFVEVPLDQQKHLFQVTLQLLDVVSDLKIRRLWLQPGSESQEVCWRGWLEGSIIQGSLSYIPISKGSNTADWW